MPFFFESPDLLYLLGIVPLQVFLLWAYWRWRKQALRQLGSPALEERLLQGFSPRRFWTKNLMFGAGIVLVILAIASPIQIQKIENQTQMSSDVIIALDVSNSMLADDVRPSRLEKAKEFILRLAPTLSGERVGLMIFAGEAFPQMPLSTDLEALFMFAQNAQPDFITNQGTDIGSAVELCKRMMENNEPNGRAIILISDGENHEEKALQRIREARAAGIVLHTIAVGTPAGSNIPEERGGLRRDGVGKVVKTTANETLMRALAQEGGGAALRLAEPDRAIAVLKSNLQNLQKTAVTLNATSEKVYLFPWLLLFALILLVLEQVMWSKKKAIATMLCLASLGPALLRAQHLTLRQGERQYDQGEYEKALETFQGSCLSDARFNAGNAAYLESDYDLSAKLYEEAAQRSTSLQEKADALYNLGNTRLMQRQYAAAISAYEQSLRLLPSRSDAQKNLQIAKRMLDSPPPNPPPPTPPPPPPTMRPRQKYLDQASTSRTPEVPPAQLSAEAARRLLDQAVRREEQENAATYRALSPSNRPSRLKKDW